MSDPNLKTEIAALIAATMSSSLIGGADFWAKLDLTMPQLKIILLLGQVGSASVSWLAARLDVSPPNVTGILDRLQQHGWIERTSDPQDRRVVRVVLTERAQQLLRDMNRIGDERMTAIIREMSAEDQLALRQGLNGLLASLRACDRFAGVAEAASREGGFRKAADSPSV